MINTPSSRTTPTPTDGRGWGHPLLWVLAPLAVTVVAGISMIIKSVESGAVDLLPGEYSRAGKLIALDAAARQRSRQLAADVAATIDQERRELRVRMSGEAATANAGLITAHLVHPTQAHKDVQVVLRPAGEHLVAALPANAPRRGELHLYPTDLSWRLVAPVVDGQALVLRASRQ